MTESKVSLLLAMKIRSSKYTNNQIILEFLLNVNTKASVLSLVKPIYIRNVVNFEYHDHGTWWRPYNAFLTYTIMLFIVFEDGWLS